MRDTRANRESADRVYQYLRNRGPNGASSHDVAAYLCCSQSHAAGLVAVLVKDGRAEWTGRKKNTDGRGQCKTFRATTPMTYNPPTIAPAF